MIKYGDNEYCIVGKNRVYYLTMLDGLVAPKERSMAKCEVQRSPLVERVYRTGASGFDQHALKAIYNDLGGGYIIWMRPAAKEMTVDQISEALGYKVVVVGEK